MHDDSSVILERGWIDHPFGHMRNGMFMNGLERRIGLEGKNRSAWEDL